MSSGHDVYKCAGSNLGCPAIRRILPVGHEYRVTGENDHNHAHVAEGEHRFLSSTEKATMRKVPRGLTPSLRQSIASDLNLSLKQPANFVAYDALKQQLCGAFFRCFSEQSATPWGPKIVGYRIDTKIQVVVIATTQMLGHAVSPNRCTDGYICFDGNGDHTGKYTIMRLGTVDKWQHYHDIAFMLMSSREAAEEFLVGLRLLETAIKSHFPESRGLDATKVMMDGAACEGILPRPNGYHRDVFFS